MNRNRKGISPKLRKGIVAAIITVGLALIVNLTWFFILPYLQQPSSPNIISSTNPNPIINSGNTVTVETTTTVVPKPPYVNSIVETITNDNPYKCYMVLQFKASDGFKFLPMSENPPENFRIEKGYEYQDTMKVYIKDFPPKFSYPLKLSIYTMSPDTYGGTEKISPKVLEMLREQ